MQTHSRLFLAAIAILVAMSCGATSATAEILHFTADLNGANVRPTPTDSAATGQMTMDYDTATDLFDIEIRLFDLEGTYYPDAQWPNNPLLLQSATHIHEGGPGVATPIHIYNTLAANWINSDGNNNPMTGDWTYIATDQMLVPGGLTDLLNGSYLNVHSFPPQGAQQDYRLGEIRGQIVLASSVPEPNAMTIIFTAFAVVCLRRRLRHDRLAERVKV